MKKFCFKDSDEEVKIGETVELEVLLDEDTLSVLIEAGIIEECEEYSLVDVVAHLAGRLNMGTVQVQRFLQQLKNANKRAWFTLLLKETAILLDEDYNGHISYSKELWVIENISFIPVKCAELKENEKRHDAPFHLISAFRSKEDAELALNILKPVIEELNGK